MSSPSMSFPRRPTSIFMPRQQSNQLMNTEQLITRQLSNISNGGYHGNKSASVPFMWESQPGTPKEKFPENPLPPLSPPPSFYYSNSKRSKSKGKKESSKGNLLQAIFPKHTARKGRSPSTPSSPSLSYSSSSASSSSSSSVSSPRCPTSHSVPSSPMVYSRKDEEDEHVYDVAQGCYSFMFKKVLLRDLL